MTEGLILSREEVYLVCLCVPHSLCLSRVANIGCNDNNEVPKEQHKNQSMWKCAIWVQALCEQEISVEYFFLNALSECQVHQGWNWIHAFPFPDLLLFDSYVSELGYWPTLHPQTLHPIDIPLVHSVISVLTVYILSLPPVFLSPSAQSVWAVKRINLYIPLPLLKNTVLFPGVKSQIFAAAAAAAKLLPSCPTLCDPIDGSPPGSPVPGILQARTLEWVAISFSNAWKWKVKGKSFSCVWLLATPWTTAYQAPPSMGFSRQEYWSGVPLPSPLKSLVGFKKFFIKCGPFIPLQHPLVFTPASWLSQTASSLTSIPFHMLFSPQKASFPPSLLTPSTISSQLALDYTLLWHSA